MPRLVAAFAWRMAVLLGAALLLAQPVAAQPVTLHDVAGHHRTFMESPEVEGVAREIETLLVEEGSKA